MSISRASYWSISACALLTASIMGHTTGTAQAEPVIDEDIRAIMEAFPTHRSACAGLPLPTQGQTVAPCFPALNLFVSLYLDYSRAYHDNLFNALINRANNVSEGPYEQEIMEMRPTYEALRSTRYDTPCDVYEKNTPIPTGFSSPFEVAGDGDKIISVHCDRITDGIYTRVGDGENTTFVYEKAYLWLPQQKDWHQIHLAGNNKSGVWYIGDAYDDNGRTGAINQPTAGDTTWVLAYTCSLQNNKWKCGCRDRACTKPGWQIQQLKRK